MRVVAVPCLKDNYAYLVIDGDKAAVVDPGEAAPVEEALAREGVKLVAVWATHHHADHVGGVPDLVAKHPGLEVIGHASDHVKARIAGQTKGVEDGDVVGFGKVKAQIIHNPGHTLGAITFVTDDGCAFTGDTLFGAGCGRVFEGTPQMMHDSLTRLAALPAETKVYFGHEYTASNLRFAAAVEPANAAQQARAASLPAVSTPSTMGEELATNPFLRVSSPAVMASVKTSDPVATFAAIREWKNKF